MKFTPPNLVLKITVVIAVVFAGVGLLTLSSRTYGHQPDSNPGSTGFTGFSGAETHPDGYRFAWSLPGASLLYPKVPRYSPLNLELRLNLQRPTDTPPARLEIYEDTVEPATGPRLITILEYDPNRPGPQTYTLKVPARAEGQGLKLEIRANSFQVGRDSRQLGVMFLNAEVRLPRSHLLSLFWPNPYWVAGFALLAVIVAWALRAGLSLLETILLAGMTGFVQMTVTASTYQFSWWLLLLAAGLGGLYFWDGRQLRDGSWSYWPLLAAAGLLVIFFLFSGDEHGDDMIDVFRWTTTLQNHGVWNFYNNDELFPYPPFFIYLLWFYNFVVYALGWQQIALVWRITASLFYMAVIYLLFRISREFIFNSAAPDKLDTIPQMAKTPTRLQSHRESHPEWLVIIAFNVSFLFNPVVWGQFDTLAMLPFTLAFYLTYRRMPLAGGLMIWLAFLTKPQNWFALPVLAWMLVQRCGWQKSIWGFLLGGVVSLGLSVIAFGANFNSVLGWLRQPQFMGEYQNLNPAAFNLNYLVLGVERQPIPAWLSLVGFAVVGTTVLAVLYLTRGRDRAAGDYGFGGALLIVSGFTMLIKIKERYLTYALPLMGLAALQNRRLVKLYLALSWMHLIQLTEFLYRFGGKRLRSLPDNFFWWSTLLNQEWLRNVLSALTILLFIWMAVVFVGVRGRGTGKAGLRTED